MGRVLRHGRYDDFRRRIDLAAPHDLVSIVDDADRRLLQGHIEADILVTLGHGLAPLALRGDQPVPAVVTPRLRHVPACACRGARRAQGLSRLAVAMTVPLAPVFAVFAGHALTGLSTARRSSRSG